MDKSKIFLLDFLHVLIYGFVDFMAFHTIYHCDPISAKLIRDQAFHLSGMEKKLGNIYCLKIQAK